MTVFLKIIGGFFMVGGMLGLTFTDPLENAASVMIVWFLVITMIGIFFVIASECHEAFDA